jgi:hypothetical protein
MDRKSHLPKNSRRSRELEFLRYVASVSRGEVSSQRRATIVFSRRVMLLALFLMLFLAFCGFLHELLA